MPNFTKTLNLEKPLRGEFYAIEKHNENSDKIDLAIEKITVPTIEHLKNMIELQEGDIVDIQGYYETGDGAHHKRKIEANDDGSGVQLANGLWANIVHSGEVNVSWFGIANIKSTIHRILNDTQVKKIIFDLSCEIGTVSVDTDNSRLESITGTGREIVINGELLFVSTKNSNNCITVENITLDGLNKYSRGLDYTGCKYIQGIPFRNVTIRNYTEACFESCPTIFFEVYDFKLQNSKYGIKQNRPIGLNWSTTTKIGRCYITGMKNSGIELNDQANLELEQVIAEYCGSDTSYEKRGGLSLTKCIRTTTRYCHLEANQRAIYSVDSPIMHMTLFSANNIENDSISWKDISVSDRYNSSYAKGTATIPIFLTQSIKRVDGKAIMIDDKAIIEENYIDLGVMRHTKVTYTLPNSSDFFKAYEIDYSEYVELECLVGKTDLIAVNGRYVIEKGVMIGPTTSYFKINLNALTNKIEFLVKSRSNTSYALNVELNISYIRSKYKNVPAAPFTVKSLDTPYHATKMQQEGIYEDFISYIDSKHEYEKQQRKLEEQRQLAFENREDQEQSYEDWLSTQPQLMPFAEPQPSQVLLDFKKKYLG